MPAKSPQPMQRSATRRAASVASLLSSSLSPFPSAAGTSAAADDCNAKSATPAKSQVLLRNGVRGVLDTVASIACADHLSIARTNAAFKAIWRTCIAAAPAASAFTVAQIARAAPARTLKGATHRPPIRFDLCLQIYQ